MCRGRLENSFPALGQGFATEAAQGALRVGFERLHLPEIVSFTAVFNLRSRAVMEKLHMREATDTFEHPNVDVENKLRQHCLYRLSREQWALLLTAKYMKPSPQIPS